MTVPPPLSCVEQASGFFLLISAFKKPIKNEVGTWQTRLFSAARRFIVSVIIPCSVFIRTVLNGFSPKHRFYCKCKILSLTFPRGHIDLFVCMYVSTVPSRKLMEMELHWVINYFQHRLATRANRRPGRVVVCNDLMAHFKQMPFCPILSQTHTSLILTEFQKLNEQ